MNTASSGPLDDGTGKTTWLAKQVVNGAKRYGSSNVLIASLTRAAAAEIGGRDIALDRWQVGTLHSHAFRALGLQHDKVAESPKGLAEWNSYAPEEWHLSGAAQDVDDPLDWKGGGMPGDPLLARYHTLRHQMTPRHEWPQEVGYFAEEWEHWKQETERTDFTDMIEVALHSVDRAPGSPALFFVDEAQDLSRLELSLVRQWGRHCEQTVVVGDPDQNLYEWRGSDPAAFHDPAIPDDHYRTLSQSYRVPRAVHSAAVGWIERVVGRRAVHYQPRRQNPDDATSPVVEGTVRYATHRWATPDERFFDDIEAETAKGRTVMILTTCAYMLDPMVKAMRERALLYHNPYRLKAGRWNPLHDSTRERLLAYLRPNAEVWGEEARLWALGDLQRWAEHLRAEFYVRGMKAALGAVSASPRAHSEAMRVEEVLLYLTEPALASAWALDVEWWRQAQTKAGRTSGVEYATEAVKAHGPKVLRERPRIIVGTVHSVKGGQADVVYVFPDLSSKGFETWGDGSWGSNPSAVQRVFYVAMTRAREELVICEPSTPRHVVL